MYPLGDGLGSPNVGRSKSILKNSASKSAFKQT